MGIFFDYHKRNPTACSKMGFISDFSKDEIRPSANIDPNPNPGRYKLLRSYLSKTTKMFIVEIRYDGCTTYEGRKILVFFNKTSFDRLHKNKWIDPHFTLNKGLIARFNPELWDMACMFADKIT